MQSGSQSKILGIELLRFFAAFAVLAWHYRHFAFTGGQIQVCEEAFPFYPFLSFFYENGAKGVEVFWCVSGFIFFFKYMDALSSGAVGLGEFAVNRFSRLYPLHFLTLLLVAALQPLYRLSHGFDFVFQHNDLRHFLLNVGFASHWGLQEGYSFNAPIWSVSLEVIVYMVFFVVASRLRLGLAYLSTVLLVALFWRLGAVELAFCLMYFFLGGLVAVFRLWPERIFVRKWWKDHAFNLLGGVLLSVSALCGVLHTRGAGEGMPGFFMQVTLVVSCVWLFVAMSRLFEATPRVWTFLGNLTYSSYLMHFPVQLVIVILFSQLQWKLDLHSPWLFLGYVLGTYLLAAVLYRQVELPCQTLLRGRLKGLVSR
jgi:peptidoglycan/LPS O-acetylase OafA/YrhL